MLPIVLSLLSNPASAGSFLTPLAAPTGPTATATLTDGSTVTGKPNAKVKGAGNIKSIKIKSAEGKWKLAPGDVQRLELTPGKLAQLATASAGMGSVSEMLQQDAGEALDRSLAVYLPGNLPNGKVALLQLLNPGMDELIQVFPDPKGKETGGISVGGVQATGGVLKTYLVRKTGEMGHGAHPTQQDRRSVGPDVQRLRCDDPSREGQLEGSAAASPPAPADLRIEGHGRR